MACSPGPGFRLVEAGGLVLLATTAVESSVESSTSPLEGRVLLAVIPGSDKRDTRPIFKPMGRRAEVSAA